MNKKNIKKTNLLKKIEQDKTTLSFDIIKSTILTEKTTDLELNKKIISFVVPIWANKLLIRSTIESIFKVKVLFVNTMNSHGKLKSFQGKKFFKQPVKKAMVKVNRTDKIGEFFNV